MNHKKKKEKGVLDVKKDKSEGMEFRRFRFKRFLHNGVGRRTSEKRWIRGEEWRKMWFWRLFSHGVG